MAVFLLKIIIGGNFLPLAVHASTTVKLDFSWPVVWMVMQLDCTVHWDVKLEWYLIHIDDIVITNLVVHNLRLDKGTEWLQYQLAP